MNLKISPTRQELLKLKKRLALARSGHQLLKHKMDSLLREFLKHIEEIQKLQKDLGERLPQAFFLFFEAQNSMGEEEVKNLVYHIKKAVLSGDEVNIMGVPVREYAIENAREIIESSFSEVTGDRRLSLARKEIFSLLEDVIKYATLEQKVTRLAKEIESTRRRVNSLEYVYIPGLESSRKYIYNKLEENERYERTVLIKLKTFNS